MSSLDGTVKQCPLCKDKYYPDNPMKGEHKICLDCPKEYCVFDKSKIKTMDDKLPLLKLEAVDAPRRCSRCGQLLVQNYDELSCVSCGMEYPMLPNNKVGILTTQRL